MYVLRPGERIVTSPLPAPVTADSRAVCTGTVAGTLAVQPDQHGRAERHGGGGRNEPLLPPRPPAAVAGE